MRILVVHKSLRTLSVSADSLEPLRNRRPERAAHHERAAAAHRESMERVRAALTQFGVHHDWTQSATVEQVQRTDAVITVGGDGTLLSASHSVRDRPVLGVNSAPSFSVGYFATATADTLLEHLEGVRSGSLPIVELARIRVLLNGELQPRYALNEVLFAHQSPAGTSRYTFEVGGVVEPQRSSGIWIATAAGSSAAIASAGGVRQPLQSRELQYLVREPFHFSDHEARSAPALIHGFTNSTIRVVSEALTSAVYIDGPRRPIAVELGDEVCFDTQAPPLRLYWRELGHPA